MIDPMNQLSVLILTRDEERNIEKCLRSVLPLTTRIFIVDSGSTDRTVEIAEGMGAVVKHHPWTSYGEQFNWGLADFDFETDWVMRLDADEEISEGLASALRNFLSAPPENVSGVYVRLRVYFMGRWIRYGGYYSTWLLRIFRNGVGRCEARWMDEHIVLSYGDTVTLRHDVIDRNLKDLTFWTDKHNKYASREILDVMSREVTWDSSDETLKPSLSLSPAHLRRWLKNNVYLRLPLFVRPFLYFVYRYFLRFGFLDGREGLIFHVLQGFWYRFLVDAKLYEYRKSQRSNGES